MARCNLADEQFPHGIHAQNKNGSCKGDSIPLPARRNHWHSRLYAAWIPHYIAQVKMTRGPFLFTEGLRCRTESICNTLYTACKVSWVDNRHYPVSWKLRVDQCCLGHFDRTIQKTDSLHQVALQNSQKTSRDGGGHPRSIWSCSTSARQLLPGTMLTPPESTKEMARSRVIGDSFSQAAWDGREYRKQEHMVPYLCCTYIRKYCRPGSRSFCT